MPSRLDPSTLIQRDIVDVGGNKVGPVGQIYLDNDTRAPEWVSIQTGLFGTKESFVPLRGAKLRDDYLEVPYDKATIKDAPRLDGDQHLDPEQEVELYRYYDVPYPEGAPAKEQESGSFLARTEHYSPGHGRRLGKYVATDHEIAEAHRARLQRGSGL